MCQQLTSLHERILSLEQMHWAPQQYPKFLLFYAMGMQNPWKIWTSQKQTLKKKKKKRILPVLILLYILREEHDSNFSSYSYLTDKVAWKF